MHFFTSQLTVAVLMTLRTGVHAAYTLKDDYSSTNFFSMFDFSTDADPTQGYVQYIAQSAAQSAGLINTNNGQVFMGVDTKNVASGSGRQSVRLTSKAIYNGGLIILDLAHMPGSVCGTWPAFWTVGPDWPNNGEIDIIEGVNLQSHNAMTLHTGAGCSISSTSNKRSTLFSGTVATSNCDINAAGQAQNAGCSISTSETSSYGSGFNSAGGGVYATEWTDEAISIWFFPSGSAPANINTAPDPTTWGLPLASFPSTSCDISSKFKNHQIVFDTTFCGQWAGAVWSTDATCSAKAATCQDFVQNNPTAFTESYWSVNSLKVFTSDGSSSSPGVSSVGSAVPTASKPPVSSGIPSVVPTGSIPISIPGYGTVPVAPPSGVPASYKTYVPSTTFATSMGPAPVSWAPGAQGWTRTGGWGGHRPGVRDVSPEQATATSSPENEVGAEASSTDAEGLNSVQLDIDEAEMHRHLARHKRHGHHHGRDDF